MRRRVSTTVDGDLLDQARGLQAWDSDAEMMDAALEALAKRHRSAEIDAQYEVYDRVPLSTPDAWGDLESFLTADLHQTQRSAATDTKETQL
ncbi:MAG: antitoxin MazE5 [Acidimicrobiaceae bacterium]|nr:antitoxin MazE5 [Acidimicrobiaceae bacterium]